MKKITIERLVLDNFKCHRHLELRLGGKSAALYGDNAAGKTSVYDALTWLLFGKDSQGRQADDKLCCVKPLGPDGAVLDHAAVTSVEAELRVDGAALTLCRQLTEKWAQRRGAQQLVFDGNETAYFVDGVPCKKMEYSRRIEELIDEDTFRMLTNLRHFPEELPWQKRRAVLFDLAGGRTDGEIMQTDPRFAPLRQEMGALELGDYQKKLAARLRGLRTDTDTLPQRIDENQLRLQALEGMDAEAARRAAAEQEAEKGRLHTELAALRQNTAVQAIHSEVAGLRLELSELERENDRHRASQQAALPDAGALERQLRQLAQDAERLRREAGRQLVLADRARAGAAALERKICQKREQWIREDGTRFSGGSCPTCGQPLPGGQLSQAREQFETDKQARLRALEAEADELKAELAERGQEAEQAGAAAAAYEKEADQSTAQIPGLQRELKALRQRQAAVEDLPDYGARRAALEEQIRQRLDRARQLEEDSRPRRAELEAALRRADGEIARNMAIVARAEERTACAERIDQLRRQARQAAQELEQAEQMRYLIEEFIRYKAQFAEDSVNGMFHLARFRLFFQQANGAVDDRCDVVYDGIPYGSLNNGMRINVGADIIRTLSRHYGVRVPLFVDNAESVTHLEQPDTQVIRLVVSEQDKQLRLEAEDED